MKNIAFSLCLIFLFSLTGCAGRISLEEATQAGAHQLSADNIDTLVSGNSLHMVAWDKSIAADIEFSDNGKLDAINSTGEKTFGRWSTDDERHRLCLQFKFWDNGATNCYKVFKDQDHYLLFNNDGTLANTFVPEREIGYTLADMNAGVLGSPPPGSETTKVARKTRPLQPAPAPVAVPAPAPEGSLLSTITFGLLGSSDNGEMPEDEEDTRQEFVPAPQLMAKTLSKPHQQLLDTDECPGCNLSGVDLSGTKLKGANLAGADLSGANLQEVNLKGANLKGANLQSARLTDAILIGADLENADLSDANLHWADLSKANLKNANMERAYLVKTFFYKADLTGANMSGVQSQRTIFEKAIGVPEHLLNNNTNSNE
ncbi:MAG: pentapeptide repeat-containing protein [Proteobacteria bacterium]|nr:pentapeptide repeat-containing protein [Pseudomonadota bacterium]MBU1640165.1 pentapeptide repeat-containing protein [Pseudomonadota bacterium]